MAKNMTHMTVLVASPQDVAAEREYLEEVISELNISLGKDYGVYLDLLRWETSGYPAVGSDPQEVINTQMGNDYDIFIGLLWHRFGTPTPRSASGTAEEFERAYQRHKEDPDSVRIMFYFKDAPVSPSEIDPKQFLQVVEFRSKLGQEGVLYWTFNDRENFGRLLRIHLTKQIQDWRQSERTRPLRTEKEVSSPEILPAKAELLNVASEASEEEEGVFEALERGGEGSEVLNQILGRMTKAIQELGTRVEARAGELESIGDPGEKFRKAKVISNQAAADLEQFAAGMEAEIDLFSTKQRSTIDAWLKVVSLQGDLSKEGAKESLESLRNLRRAMVETRGKMSSMRNSIATIPRMTTALNRGKRKAVNALDRFDRELRDGITLLDEIDPDAP